MLIYSQTSRIQVASINQLYMVSLKGHHYAFFVNSIVQFCRVWIKTLCDYVYMSILQVYIHENNVAWIR